MHSGQARDQDTQTHLTPQYHQTLLSFRHHQ